MTDFKLHTLLWVAPHTTSSVTQQYSRSHIIHLSQRLQSGTVLGQDQHSKIQRRTGCNLPVAETARTVRLFLLTVNLIPSEFVHPCVSGRQVWSQWKCTVVILVNTITSTVYNETTENYVIMHIWHPHKLLLFGPIACSMLAQKATS